jgi:nicotinate-nucleotide adenylyltransferase
MSDKMKKIAILGGSFNPPHPAHFELAARIHTALDVDEVWISVSNNRFKDSAKYASLQDRLDMCEALKQFWPNTPLVITDIESRIGTNISYDVLARLRLENPDKKFVWTMGADNLVSFHTWEDWNKIIEEFGVAVFSRPGYNEDALKSPAARAFAAAQAHDPVFIPQSGWGWALMSGMGMDMSSTQLRKALEDGSNDFDPRFQPVADIIRARGLYGTGAKRSTAPAPAP